ncbi:hypothetical protein BGW38_005622, partial [Lunasporangiospora selenospora]
MGNDSEESLISNRYPSNARIGRFYLPEHAYRPREALEMKLESESAWVCCEFTQYPGVSLWVLETVLDKYHELSMRHTMALTLIPRASTGPKMGLNIERRDQGMGYDAQEDGEKVVRMKELILHPAMIQHIWRDMHY